MKVVIDGIEYVPRCDAPDLTQTDPTGAARELLMWLYLGDKPGNAIWGALEKLNPVLARMVGEIGAHETLVAAGMLEDE